MKDRSLPFLLYRRNVRKLYVLPYAFLFLLMAVMTVGFLGVKAPQEAQATTPKIIYYQGKIAKTSDGTNIADGNYSMRFKIYSTLGSGTPPTGGSLLWTETWDGVTGGSTQVAFKNGLFSVALGTYTSLSTVDFTTGALYLSVDFNPGAGYDGEMAPRQQLTSTPFAISANGVSGDGAVNTTLSSATALTVANSGANYAFQVDTSTASSATGLLVKSAAATGGAALSVISSGTNENLTIDAKGTGTISLGATSTGNLLLGGTTGDVLLAGGSAGTGCTVTNSTGAFACTAGGSFTTLGLTGAVTGATSYNGLVITANTGVITTGTWNGSIIGGAYGGTGNGFFQVSGPTTSTKTFTFPNASATVLTDNALVTVAQGGTGSNATGFAGTNGVVYYDGTKLVGTAASTGNQCLQTATSGSVPIWGSCGAGGATAFDVIGDPTGNGAIAMGATVQTLDWGSITSTTGLAITGGSAMTSGTLFKVGSATFNHTAAQTGNLANLTFTDATTNAFTTTTNGLQIVPTINAASGAATRTINGLSVEPAFTNCAAGTCAVNGLNVANVVDGTGFTGTGLKVGTGWDYAATFASGNVGIGITTPGSLLQLEGGTSADQLRMGSGANYYKMGRDTGSGLLAFDGTQAGFRGYSFTGDSQFNVSGMTPYFDNSGSSQLYVRTSGAAQQAGIQLVNTSRSYGWYLENRGGLDTPNDRFAIFNNGGAEMMSILTGGNIGFGVKNPDEALHISDSAGGSLGGNKNIKLTTSYGGALTSGNDETFIYFDDATKANGWGIGRQNYCTNVPHTSFVIMENDSCSGINFQVEAGGDVGIGLGDALPAARLAVKAAATTVNAFQILNSGGLAIENVNTSSGTGAANLIYNGSFEQNIHNWVAKGTPTGSTPVWDNTAANAKFGNGTLKFSGDAAGDGAQYGFPFAPSTSYSASFWAKTASGTATLRLDRQDNGSDVGGCSDSAVTTTWTQFTCSFTTGGTINTSTSNIFIKQNAAGTPTVYIDGFTLTTGATPLSYAMPGNNIQVDADYSNITLNAGQDADIQPWQSNSTPISTARRGATSVTANGFAYYIGGNPNGAPSNAVLYTRINADGSLSAGSWLSATGFPVALYGHASFVANGYLYIIGGCSDSSATAACTTPVNTVYYSKLNSDGTLGAWQTSANTLPAARGFGAAIFSNGFLYYLGGYNASAQTAVYSARLNADGSVSGWTTTGVTALGTGRYGHTTMNVNGKIYSIGGCTDAGALCNTAITTVEYATPANDGTLGAWTAATSLPVGTGFHTTGMMNGYLFNMGGRQASAAVSTVYYAKVNSVGPLGAWTTSSNPLPAARQQSASLYVNTYLYNMGGYDGTTLATSVFFGSGARVTLFGGLDLLGLTSQTLTDYSGGGTLTAGNTRVVGDLRVDGFADLNNGLSVDSVINLNAVSAVLGQNIFNINNSLSNSIFSVRHMSPTIGSLVTAGVVIQNMSNGREEFSASKAGVATAASTGAYGDSAKWYVNNSATTVNTGLTTSNPNGFIRIAPTAVSGIGGEVAFGATAGTLDKIFTPNNNLPIVQMKVRPSVMSATDDFIWGMFDQATAPTVNDTLPANGIFFWGNNGTGSTGWVGVVRLASANLGTVTCPGSATAAKWATGRIEVMSNSGSNTVVHFMIDNDSSDGVNMIDCGTVTTASIWTAGTTLGYGMYDVHTVASATTFDMDYASWWQDDNTDAPAGASADTSSVATETPTVDALTVNSEVPGFDAAAILASFMSQVPIEESQVKQTQVDRLLATQQIVTPNITANGLVIDRIGELGKMISIFGDMSFIGRPYFNNDTAGFAVIKTGDKKVDVVFNDQYLTQPIVNASVSLEQDDTITQSPDADLSILKNAEEQSAQNYLDSGATYIILHKSTKGFTIMLNKPALQDVKFSWIALAVKDAKISLSSTTVSPDQNAGTVAGDVIKVPAVSPNTNTSEDPTVQTPSPDSGSDSPPGDLSTAQSPSE